MSGISESKLNMWRTVVSLAHADGIFHINEEEYLKDLISALKLTDDQRNTLLQDLESPQDSKEIFSKITEPGDRSQVFYFGRILLWVDEDFSHSEEEVFNRLKEVALDKVDFEEVMKRVNAVAEEYKAKEELKREQRTRLQKIIDAMVFWKELP